MSLSVLGNVVSACPCQPTPEACFAWLQGLFAGYFSSRLYKSFRGEEWKKTTLRTALLFPGVRRESAPH